MLKLKNERAKVNRLQTDLDQAKVKITQLEGDVSNLNFKLAEYQGVHKFLANLALLGKQYEEKTDANKVVEEWSQAVADSNDELQKEGDEQGKADLTSETAKLNEQITEVLTQLTTASFQNKSCATLTFS